MADLVLQGDNEVSDKPKRNREEAKYIINKLLESSEGVYKKESKAAGILLNRYPSLSFWRFFELEYKIKSLYFLTSGRGKDVIDNAYNLFRLPRSEKPQTFNGKRLSRVTPRKPKNLKEFLNG